MSVKQPLCGPKVGGCGWGVMDQPHRMVRDGAVPADGLGCDGDGVRFFVSLDTCRNATEGDQNQLSLLVESFFGVEK
jgi:hypothetical protein